MANIVIGIEGHVGSGKTSILEAIYFFEDLKSFRKSDILDVMEGTFTKRRMSYKNKIVVKNGKTQNVINKYYEYEIIQTFNDSMIPVQELDEDLDLPW